MNRIEHYRWIIVMAALAIVGVVPTARAQVAIAWNNCLGTVTATQALQYACDGSLDGNPRKLALSFDMPADVDSLNGTFAVIEFRSLAPAMLPDYWKIHAGECREGVIGFVPVASGVGHPTLCPNPFAGYSYTYAHAATAFNAGPDYFRMDAAFGVGGNIPIQGGAKYSAGVVTIEPYVGDCTGCEQEICIQLVSIAVTHHVYGTGTRNQALLSGPNSTSFVTWQGAAPGMCFGATPARNQTWGSVKALYR